MSEMGAAEFKAHCLQVMETVRRTRREVIITKRGVPVAKLVPADPPKVRDVFGCMSGEFEIVGDLDVPLRSEKEWKELERQREEQWKMWDREWRRSRAASGRATTGSPRRRRGRFTATRGGKRA
jgi:prevent-host-death family protein